jgi:hypothetical protein
MAGPEARASDRRPKRRSRRSMRTLLSRFGSSATETWTPCFGRSPARAQVRSGSSPRCGDARASNVTGRRSVALPRTSVHGVGRASNEARVLPTVVGVAHSVARDRRGHRRSAAARRRDGRHLRRGGRYRWRLACGGSVRARSWQVGTGRRRPPPSFAAQPGTPAACGRRATVRPRAAGAPEPGRPHRSYGLYLRGPGATKAASSSTAVTVA